MQIYNPNNRAQTAPKKRYVRKIYYWRIAFFISLICVIVLIASYFLIPRVTREGRFYVEPRMYFFLATSSYSNPQSARIASAQSMQRGGAGFIIEHKERFLVISQTFDSELSAQLALYSLEQQGSMSASIHTVLTSKLVLSESDAALYPLFIHPTLLYTNISNMQNELTTLRISEEAVLLDLEHQAAIIQSKLDELNELEGMSQLRNSYMELYKVLKGLKNIAAAHSLNTALSHLQAHIAYHYLALFLP